MSRVVVPPQAAGLGKLSPLVTSSTVKLSQGLSRWLVNAQDPVLQWTIVPPFYSRCQQGGCDFVTNVGGQVRSTEHFRGVGRKLSPWSGCRGRSRGLSGQAVGVGVQNLALVHRLNRPTWHGDRFAGGHRLGACNGCKKHKEQNTFQAIGHCMGWVRVQEVPIGFWGGHSTPGSFVIPPPPQQLGRRGPPRWS